MTTIYTTSEREARVMTSSRKPYMRVGAFVVLGIVAVILLGALGASSPGIVDVRSAFFMTAGAILILALAMVYLFFTLNDALRILHVHEQRIPEIQKQRDASQDTRITALERRMALGSSSVSATSEAALARLEERIAALERRPAAPSVVAAAAVAPTATVRPAPARGDPFGDVHPVIDVEGIGPAYEQRLKALGIHTTRDLWHANTGDVATKLGVGSGLVREWQQMAELMALKGIGKQYAEVLVKAGIGSIAQLRAADPDEIAQRIEKAEEGLAHRIQKNTITPKIAEGWIHAARTHQT
ncbi:MAG TPA: DUF4332 domain-containing protein [Candidatus Thermoplasmatota archaeon]|nr:DUF4332 domain-containing protein [Candidatus Thermoplasmatota archaeon]